MSLQTTTGSGATRVVRFDRLDQLARLAADWDRLAGGVPFRSWAWTSTWWRHWGDGRRRSGRKLRLFVLVVFDGADLPLGIAPWYLENSLSQGRVLRFLGTGEVCSDYLGVLAEPGAEEPVASALACWLSQAARARALRPDSRCPDRWDLLELCAVDAQDHAVQCLVQELRARGCAVHCQAGPNCWRIELPGSWQEYLGRLSRTHRKRLRRAQRAMLESGRLKVHTVGCLADLPQAEQILIDLHQRRRRLLGQPGCFASERFRAFHRQVMPQLLRNGQLRLGWLELDGQAVAAEYHLVGSGVVYAYQGGIDPGALAYSPGWLSTMVSLQQAIEQGYRAFDFLRGDEPYKAHWRAQARPTLHLRVVPPRTSAQLRQGVWLAGTSVKRWIKAGLRPLAKREP